jgi:adenosylhomocysteinase
MEKAVYEVPQAIDDRVSQLKMIGMGLQIDRLTPEQEKYLAGWEV